MSNTKATGIIINVLAPAHKRRMSGLLGINKFVVSIDEGTDITVDSFLCIVVRYVDVQRRKICSSLFDLAPIYDIDDLTRTPNAENLTKKVLETFREANIPYNNIIEFCSDTASVMVGSKNSVATRLHELITHLIVIKCACHIEHLCAQDAGKMLPSNCEQFPSTIYNYISCSSARVNNWMAAQKLCGVQPLKILKPYKIRWLTEYFCIKRVLQRWTPLKTFFGAECMQTPSEKSQITDSEKSPQAILMYLNDSMMKGYLSFLYFALGHLVRVNHILQSESPLVPLNIDKMAGVYKDLLKMYMVDEYVEGHGLYEIDPNDAAYFKPLAKIDVGSAAYNILQTAHDLNELQKTEMLQYCQKYLIEACLKMRQRCTFSD